jgi:hypothetical protein
MTGITYPTVMVGDKEYTVRFSLLAECLLGSIGITLKSLAPKDSATYLIQRMQLFAAAVAETFPDPMKAPGWAKWAAQITRAEWPAIDAAIDEAIKKALEESSPASQPMTPLAATLQ